ncbi:O-methyltransferase [Echinicola vietnamensis]|uniref:Putative O-methyltransferase n=1 Tax=Echinicola vietnamensis (strain DSM 17526 / LMG 23754 / KMM 6221) TaxID=926556 RepID=L0FXL2_ECHVK|nr:class I SAM-dependent methyltransferase [Echinicola vietnamensis]AGA78639.1 putative O-methyltransferase [Echinicola vietnamensis DSM 17526]
MFDQIHPFFAYLRYFLLKVDRHSLQAPYAYEVYEGLKEYAKTHRSPALESKREKLLANPAKITIQDHGTGSLRLKNPLRKIAAITRHSASKPKFSLLYQYFCSLTPAQTVLELGTCVGITTAYLAQSTQGKVYTFEGADELAEVAKGTFGAFPEIHLIAGRIQETLPEFLQKVPGVDFVLMDAHHNYEATIFFWKTLLPALQKTSVVAIGDIHRSKEMEKAWNELKSHSSVTMSMDFYECGILFFKAGLKKQHYILHY